MHTFVIIIVIALTLHYILTLFSSYIPEFAGQQFELDPRQKRIAMRMKDMGAFFCGDCKSYINLLGSHGEEVLCSKRECGDKSGVYLDGEIHNVRRFVDLERIFLNNV